VFQLHHVVLWTETVQTDMCWYPVSNGPVDKQKTIAVLPPHSDDSHAASWFIPRFNGDVIVLGFVLLAVWQNVNSGTSLDNCRLW
jgi:hypothetical protein